MRIFLTGLFFFILFAIPSRWYYVCEIRNNCGEEPTEILPIPRAKTLQLIDGDSIILEGYEQFAFDSIAPIMTADNQEFLKAITDYLNENPDKNLTITGHFTKAEQGKHSGIHENLGIARAAKIEELLEGLEIEEERISIDYEMVNGNDLKEPLAFSLYIPEENPDDYAKLQFRFEDMTFSDANFEFQKADFKPTQACLNYFDSLQIVLTEDLATILVITGHTDSIGTDEFNYKLGLDRADNAAKFIKGDYEIPSDIQTQSLGEKESVAPNTNADGTDNEEGRQKNRRVNFRLVKKDIEE